MLRASANNAAECSGSAGVPGDTAMLPEGFVLCGAGLRSLLPASSVGSD